MIIIIASGGQTEEETRWRPEEATSGVPDRWPCRLPPPPEVTPQVGQGRGHRKMVGSRAQRGLRAQAAAAAEEEEQEPPVILISDEDSDEGHGASVLLLAEPLEDSVLEEEKSEEIVDEESGLVVTFCKKGNVMPHARYDCMTNLFERAECETCIPLERNAETCGQCYCYICDKPASECQSWTTPALCHCNAHNKSKYWKGQRDFTLAGVLATFNLELSEIDRDLRRGGERALCHPGWSDQSSSAKTAPAASVSLCRPASPTCLLACFSGLFAALACLPSPLACPPACLACLSTSLVCLPFWAVCLSDLPACLSAKGFPAGVSEVS
uniref:Uncharacterized protein n=1 Tax=Ornithorhynchus anatinus TaxID=9258 RepID=A0A6I8NDC8_ORNAN